MAAITETLYTGDGSTVLFSITFPYLESTDVKASLDGSVTTAFTLPTATTLQFNSAPGNGVAIRIYRDTDDSALPASFVPDSSLRSADLNSNFTQLLYIAQEADDNADRVGGAVDDASNALTLATTAEANASAALAAVSAVVPVGDVANVAAIPGSPDNGEVVRVVDSTGIESFTPLAGLPGGFVGDSGVAVTISWDTVTWNYVRYEPNDPDARYLGSGVIDTAQLADGSITDAKIGDNVLTPIVSEINGGPLAGFRNYLINGDFRVWQRGSSFVSPVNDTYTADRWVYLRGGDARHTVFLDAADTPNDNFLISAHLDCTTADASISSTDRTSFEQYIEGRSILGLIGNTFTVSFWVKATKTGIYCFSLGNAGDDRSYVVEYTVNAANTWEFKSITITGGLITAGTWDYDTGVGLRVRWALAAGADVQTTAGAWQTGNFLATSNQVNATDSTANDWRITGVQLEVGTQATPFEFRPIGLERSLCKRYFRELWGGSANNTVGPAQVSAAAQVRVPYVLNPEMRVDPTVSGAANCFEITVGETDVFASIVGFADSSKLSGHFNCSMSSSFSSGDAGIAKARSSITFDAEL